MPDNWKKGNLLDQSKNDANGKDFSTAYDNVEVNINSLIKGIKQKQK